MGYFYKTGSVLGQKRVKLFGKPTKICYAREVADSSHPFNSYITRQTVFILLARTIFLEIMLEILAFLPRFLITFFTPDYLRYPLVVIGLEVFFILLTVIQLGMLIFLFLRWESHYYEIHITEIDRWSGILHKKKETYSFVHAESIVVSQSFLGRIFRYGTVHVYVPTLRQEIILVDIPTPHTVAEFLKQELPQKDSTVFMRR